MLTSDSPMSDVIHELLIADQLAGLEFVRRQPSTELSVLDEAGKMIAREVWTAQWTNTAAMQAHKDPEPLPRLSREQFQPLLNAAVAGDHVAVAAGLSGMNLDELSTAGSIGYLLCLAVEQRRRELDRIQRAKEGHGGPQSSFAEAAVSA